jgi:hypothetical protein
MAVSDESGAAGNPEPIRPRKAIVRLSDAQWIEARHQFESDPAKFEQSIRNIMARFDVAERTVRLRIASQGWRKSASALAENESKLHEIVRANLEPIGQQIAERIGAKVESDIAPWLEREKLKWTKDTHKLVKSRRRMVQGIVESLEDITPKDAAYIAKADDTYDQMGRRTLGMSDSGGFSGNLSVQILAGQAAVSVSQS